MILKQKLLMFYSGDALTAAVDLSFLRAQDIKLCFYGIDTPEMLGVDYEEGKTVFP